MQNLVSAFGMDEFARDRYEGSPAKMGQGKQSSWYPGQRADRALELADEIKEVCKSNTWASEIPSRLHETHMLLSGTSKRNSKATISKQRHARGDGDLDGSLLATRVR